MITVAPGREARALLRNWPHWWAPLLTRGEELVVDRVVKMALDYVQSVWCSWESPTLA